MLTDSSWYEVERLMCTEQSAGSQTVTSSTPQEVCIRPRRHAINPADHVDTVGKWEPEVRALNTKAQAM